MRRRPFRLWELVSFTAALLVAVAVIAPHQLGIVVYKLSLVTLAGCAGYWLDRFIFPYARPHYYQAMRDAEDATKDRLALLISLSMMRRALIVAAAMIAVAMGL